jgi:hypothetical protein
MRVSGTLYGGAEIVRRYHIGATFSNAGIVAIDAGNNPNGVIPSEVDNMADCLGLALGTGTYSATPAAGALGTVEVSIRPDSVLNATMSGSSTESTALTIMTNTTADTSTPDTVTSSDVSSTNDMIGGTLWRYRTKGDAPAGLSEWRIISGHTTSTNVTAAVDFEYGIAVGDKFLMCPWTMIPGDSTATTDGHGNVQVTAAFYQADASIASGSGATAMVYNLILRSETDSEVEFLLADHALGVLTT